MQPPEFDPAQCVASALPAGGEWKRDFPTEWTGLGTTGGTLWPAAGYLADFLEGSKVLDSPPGGASRSHPLRVLELGSGCGWLGICIAMNNPHVEVVMTDQETEGQLEWTQHNVDICGTPLPNIRCRPLDWNFGNEDVTSQEWDVLVGSDLVYNEAGVEMLPVLLPKLLSGSTRFLYGHTRYRYEDSDMTFLQNLRENGLQVRELWLSSQETPPPSPAPMSSIFQEKRIAVWEITREDAALEPPTERYRRAKRGPTDAVSFFALQDDEKKSKAAEATRKKITRQRGAGKERLTHVVGGNKGASEHDFGGDMGSRAAADLNAFIDDEVYVQYCFYKRSYLKALEKYLKRKANSREHASAA